MQTTDSTPSYDSDHVTTTFFSNNQISNIGSHIEANKEPDKQNNLVILDSSTPLTYQNPIWPPGSTLNNFSAIDHIGTRNQIVLNYPEHVPRLGWDVLLNERFDYENEELYNRRVDPALISELQNFSEDQIPRQGLACCYDFGYNALLFMYYDMNPLLLYPNGEVETRSNDIISELEYYKEIAADNNHQSAPWFKDANIQGIYREAQELRSTGGRPNGYVATRVSERITETLIPKDSYERLVSQNSIPAPFNE